MSITFQTTMTPESFTRLGAFPLYLSDILSNALRDISDDGAGYMRSIVPVGVQPGKGRLKGAVSTSGPSVFEGGLLASVFVDPAAAPHARYVDQGTGVDGPLHRGVSTSPKFMRFKDYHRGGISVVTPRVKFAPSARIASGKNFSGKTYSKMKLLTSAKVEEIVNVSIPAYFRS